MRAGYPALVDAGYLRRRNDRRCHRPLDTFAWLRCSGFTKYVFAQQGIQLPRTAHEQARVGESVALDFTAFRPGDLLFFAEPKEAISHVAIYVGDGRIIHASSPMGQVGYLDLDGDRAAWYVQNMIAVRRLR